MNWGFGLGRSGPLWLVVAAFLGATPAPAQQLGISVGYTRVPGRIGDRDSDHGIALRVALDLVSGRRASFGLEGELDRLNQHRRRTTQPNCLLPSGMTGTCFFDSAARDLNLSLSGVARLHANPSRVTPYFLVGVGIQSVRTHERQDVTDSLGNRLQNFSFEGTTTDGGLQAHFGGGAVIRSTSFPVGIVIEGRGTALLHNYSGGPQISVGPSLSVGVRWGLPPYRP